MRFFALFIICSLLTVSVTAQEKADTVPPKLNAIDTAAIYDSLDALLKDLMGDFKPKSYFEVSLGASNQVFDLKNNFLNTTQSAGTLVLKPGVAYYHKSGFSLAATLYAADINKFQLYQFGISPGYDLQKSKKLVAGVSYTHYFAIGDSVAKQTSPYENEVYAYVGAKKGWLKPGINFGWAAGKYKSSLYLDSLQRWVGFETKLNDISASATISHEFNWDKIFSKNDNVFLVPTLGLNAGQFSVDNSVIRNGQLEPIFLLIQQYMQQHPVYARLLKKQVVERLRKKGRDYSSDFGVQSLSLNLNLNYTIGNFSVTPSYTADYYLPKTDGDRLSNIFTINFSYSF